MTSGASQLWDSLCSVGMPDKDTMLLGCIPYGAGILHNPNVNVKTMKEEFLYKDDGTPKTDDEGNHLTRKVSQSITAVGPLTKEHWMWGSIGKITDPLGTQLKSLLPSSMDDTVGDRTLRDVFGPLFAMIRKAMETDIVSKATSGLSYGSGSLWDWASKNPSVASSAALGTAAAAGLAWAWKNRSLDSLWSSVKTKTDKVGAKASELSKDMADAGADAASNVSRRVDHVKKGLEHMGHGHVHTTA